MRNKNSKKRKEAEKRGYRSSLELEVAKDLEKYNINPKLIYECLVLNYIIPESKKKYTPDYVLPNGIIVEVKGYWSLEDRKKFLYVRESNPDKDIRMVFQNSKNKLRKSSKTTYSDFCIKNNIIFAEKKIPLNWIFEKK